MKACRKCGEVKSLDQFSKNRTAPDGLQYRCKPCARQDTAKWQRENREAQNAKTRRYKRRQRELGKSTPSDLRANLRRYGLTPEQWQEMFEAQNGVCAICLKPETRVAKGRLQRLAVDHDHDTGRVRGLLCSFCNTGIGCLQDDTEILRSAITYLTPR